MFPLKLNLVAPAPVGGRFALLALSALSLAVLVACGGGSGTPVANPEGVGSGGGAGTGTGTGAGTGTDTVGPPLSNVLQTSIPRATCGTGDRPETGLQGQVTVQERAAGFTGRACNLKLLGRDNGDGGTWQMAAYGDCAYYGRANSTSALTPNALPRPTQTVKGTAIVDMRNTAAPTIAGYLASVSMLDPWESLKVNTTRGLLASVNGTTSNNGGPEFDVYDIASNCAKPQLLYSGALVDTNIVGHEGEWAPDGQTYIGGDLTNGFYYFIDVADPKKPQLLSKYAPPIGVHGLSVSKDSSRAYFTLSGATDQGAGGKNSGLGIADFTPVRDRQPGAQPKLISEVYWDDGSIAQHTIPVKIKGRPYVITVDESGAGGIAGTAARNSACASGRLAYGIPRIFDVGDETKPKLIAKLILEIGQVANCTTAASETASSAIFGYDSHYCAVDNPDNAKMLACSYFNSGLRVFDITVPNEIKEIAYFNPAMKTGYQAGSYFNGTGVCAGADWASARPYFVPGRNEIWFTSQCAGVHAVALDAAVIPK